MFGWILVLICFALLTITVVLVEERQRTNTILATVLAAYALRLVFSFFLDDLPVFSHGTMRGDSALYEQHGIIIAAMWQQAGVHIVDATLIPNFWPTVFPGYLFGTITYLAGERCFIGCVAVIAMLSCLSIYNLYRVAIELGTQPKVAFWLMCAGLFNMACIMYGSDTSKDPLVCFFTLTILCSCIRLAKKARPGLFVLVAACFTALWYTRFYFVFMAAPTLVLAVQGLGSKSRMRTLITSLGTGIGFIALMVYYSSTVDTFVQDASTTFDFATDDAVLHSNARSGSGVSFEAGNPWGQLHLKLAYTLFAPFPWTTGSVGLHLGKVDTCIWYFLAYRGLKAVRHRWREIAPLLVIILVFIIPATIAYATTISNIGLIYRQRMAIVLAGYLLAALSWPATATVPAAGVPRSLRWPLLRELRDLRGPGRTPSV